MISHPKGATLGSAAPPVAQGEVLQEADQPAPTAAGLAGATHPEAIPPYPNVGHRGASGYAPENTIAAYDLALRLGATGIELDVQLTKDGVPVVLHDRALGRTARRTAVSGPADHTGLVREKTLAQIKNCDVGGWFNQAYPRYARPEYAGLSVPTLEEVFERYGESTNYSIEIKNPEFAPGTEEGLLRLLDEHGLRGPASRERQVIVQSFSQASLQKIHALDPSLPLLQLFRKTEPRVKIRTRLDAAQTYAVAIGPRKTHVDAALVQAAHARRLYVYTYTVNETSEMEGLVAMGVDGIFTDFPDRLEAVLHRREKRSWGSQPTPQGAA